MAKNSLTTGFLPYYRMVGPHRAQKQMEHGGTNWFLIFIPLYEDITHRADGSKLVGLAVGLKGFRLELRL